jgi:hypothetical protein
MCLIASLPLDNYDVPSVPLHQISLQNLCSTSLRYRVTSLDQSQIYAQGADGQGYAWPTPSLLRPQGLFGLVPMNFKGIALPLLRIRRELIVSKLFR